MREAGMLVDNQDPKMVAEILVNFKNLEKINNANLAIWQGTQAQFSSLNPWEKY